MINAKIRNGGQILEITLPLSPLELEKELLSIGIDDMQLPFNISGDETGVTVELYADSDIGNHLIRVFGKTDTLATVNIACSMLFHLNDNQKSDFENHIIYDQYSNTKELFDDMNYSNGWSQYKQTGYLLKKFEPPNVEVK